jgi:hypothetical protein
MTPRRKPPVTGTTHALNFAALGPADFERMCVWLVEEDGFQNVEHLGAAGGEQGRDIVASRDGKVWAFQCKNVRQFGPKDADAEIDKLLSLPASEHPEVYVFLVACAVSDRTRTAARKKLGERIDCQFWDLTDLDYRVNQSSRVRDHFFGTAHAEDIPQASRRDTGGQPAKVFISSTSEDLKTHRQAARDAAIAAGMLPMMREYFAASGEKPPLPACLARVSETDMLVVIVAHRYGWAPPDQPDGQHKSITWLECEQAVADEKEVLAFLVDEKHPWPEADKEAYRLTEAMQNGSADEALFQEVNRNVALLKDFKAWINGRGIRATFTTPEDLRRCVAEALNDWRQRHATVAPTGPIIKPPTKPCVPPAYIEWLLTRCGDVELMGLELTHGSGVRLNHVYTPLATSARLDEAERKARRQRKEMPTELQRESKQLLLELLDKQSLYVSGDPGSGKSTFCRWVTWLTCYGEMPVVDEPAPKEYGETFPDSLRGRLPVLVRLSEFWQHLPADGVRSVGMGGLERALERWLADRKHPGIDATCLKAHLDDGSALLILDGVDEVPPIRKTDGEEWYPREMLLAGLAEAVARWTKAGNRVLVTSRPYGLNAEQQRRLALAHAPILGLDQPLQALLVRRWFIRLKESRDLGLETADTMIDHIHVERGLDDLAGNPLLLTAMCIIYDQGKRLPHDKYVLYDRIVETVLHKRYADKERIDPIRERLAALALGMHTGAELGQQRSTPEATASDREIDAILQAYQQLDGATDKGVSDTVRVREDLLSQSGLLVSRGDDTAAFYHLSIQEFLAGERLHVLHIRAWDDLIAVMMQRAASAGWRNTCSFLFGCLVAKTSRHVGVEFLQEIAKRLTIPAADPSRRGQQAGAWNQAIVLGDCLQILAGREAAIPDSLTRFFQQCVFQAIEQEIAVKDRHTLAVALGRLGDPRIVVDLRWKTHPDDHPGYVKIDAGKYRVGDEKRAVKIAEPFWLSKYPVTTSQYAQFLQDGGYSRPESWSDEGWQWVESQRVAIPAHWRDPEFNAPNQPVVGVSWWEAEAFCRWAGGALPTEQQWEAAARGPEGLVYPWGDEWEDDICNSDEAQLGGTSAVGIFPRDESPFGLKDMVGNVWEWCADSWGGSDRVSRGGGWAFDAEDCRAAFRYWVGPSRRLDDLGFRLARTVSFPSR